MKRLMAVLAVLTAGIVAGAITDAQNQSAFSVDITPALFTPETAGVVIVCSGSVAFSADFRILWRKLKPQEFSPPSELYNFTFVYEGHGGKADTVIPSQQSTYVIRSERESGAVVLATVWEGKAVGLMTSQMGSAFVRIVFPLDVLKKMRSDGLDVLLVNVEASVPTRGFDFSLSQKVRLAEIFALIERPPDPKVPGAVKKEQKI